MPRYDYRCPTCGRLEANVWKPTGGTPNHPCLDCNADMERLPSAPNFSIHGYSAKNGYSSK